MQSDKLAIPHPGGHASYLAPEMAAGREGLDAILTAPRAALLATDFDGVLAPIVADPLSSRPVPGVVDILADLCGLVGQVLILTGRQSRVVADLIDAENVAGLESLVIVGQYGAERLDVATGVLQGSPVPDGLSQARGDLPELLADHGYRAAYVEDKGRALAVHTRRLDAPGQAWSDLRPPIAGLAAATGLMLEAGNLVLELRQSGVDKGTALRAVAAERRFQAVLYAGDDLGDISAFDAVDELRADGVAGLLIASAASDVDELIGRADIVVEGPQEAARVFSELSFAIHQTGHVHAVTAGATDETP